MQSAVKDGEFAVLSPTVQLAIFLQTYLFANTAKPTEQPLTSHSQLTCSRPQPQRAVYILGLRQSYNLLLQISPGAALIVAGTG